MKPSEVRTARDRWRTAGGRELARGVARWLAGSARRPREIAEIDGRTDLRGLVFPTVRVVGPGKASINAWLPELTGVELRGLDLSGSVIRNAALTDVHIADCLFDSADLVDWRVFATTVSNSSFVGADLDGALLGTSPRGGRHNRWNHVNFDRANLRRAIFNHGVLHNATFRRAKIKRTHFDNLDMASVTFEGLIDHSRFFSLPDNTEEYREHWMRDVDFTQAVFRDGQLEGYRTDNVRLPPDVLLITDFPAVHNRALQAAETTGNHELLAELDFLTGKAELAGTEPWDFALFVSDLVPISGDKAYRIRDAYERAAR